MFLFSQIHLTFLSFSKTTNWDKSQPNLKMTQFHIDPFFEGFFPSLENSLNQPPIETYTPRAG